MRTDGTATLDHYLKPILEHKNLIIAVTAVTALLAVAASLVLPPSYRSTASVLLTPISGNPLTPLESDTDVDMATELLISTSKAVVARVAEDLTAQSTGVDPDKLADNVSASSPRESKVLDLTYRAATPELAQLIANSFAENYLEYREQIASENRSDAVELLNDRIALLKDQLSQIEGRLSQMESGTQPYVAASVERDSIDGELQAQQEALAALSTLTLSAGEILSPARLPVAPTGPGLITLLVGGLAGGLVVGVVSAMLLSAVQASRVPRNRRASDHIEQNRRQEDRSQIGGRRAGDGQTESAVEKLARVTAGREQSESDDHEADSDGHEAEDDGRLDEPADKTADKRADKTAAEGTDEPAEDGPDTPPGDATEQPVDNNMAESADKTADEPADKTADKKADKTAELADMVTAIDKAAEEAVGLNPAESTLEPADTASTRSPTPAPTAGPVTHSVVHQGEPPAPPPAAAKQHDRRRDDGPHATAEEEPDVVPDPGSEAPVLPIDHVVAAHFGDDVPPPPRNKAKLKGDSAPAPNEPPHDRRANGSAAAQQASLITPSLEVEADFDRLVGEIREQLAVGPLTCLAVGQDHRAQSVAAGFALVDGLKDLEVDVLILDATLDEPVLAEVLELPNIPGLSELIVGQAPMEATIQQLEGFTGLYAVTVGKPTPLSRSAFGTPKLRDLLRQAKQRFPVTVIIGGDIADAALLSQAGGALDGLVVAASAPPGQPADPGLVEALSALNAPVWVRISVAVDPGPTASAANAATTV